MTKIILKSLVIIVGILSSGSAVHSSSETSWKIIGTTNGSCWLKASNMGVNISIMFTPESDLYSINVERPSILNDLRYGSINWPSQREFDVDHEDEDIFAVFMAATPKKMKLKMAHAGGGDGDISSFDENDVYKFVSFLAKYNNVELYKRYSTSSGIVVTRLGSWIASSKLDKEKIQKIRICVNQSK